MSVGFLRPRRGLQELQRRRTLRKKARADLERRVRGARLRRAGLTEQDAYLAMRTAFDLWQARRPWRWLPVRARPLVFTWVAREEIAERAARRRGE